MSRFGKKFTCYKCGSKFYDLNRPEAVCPKCGANQGDAPTTKSAFTPIAASEDAEEEETRRRPAESLYDDDTIDVDDDLDLDDEEIDIGGDGDDVEDVDEEEEEDM
jgi:hypothetical protein